MEFSIVVLYTETMLPKYEIRTIRYNPNVNTSDDMTRIFKVESTFLEIYYLAENKQVNVVCIDEAVIDRHGATDKNQTDLCEK